MEIVLTPIGQVESPVGEKMSHGWKEIESTITIFPELVESLDGIEEFSHIEVLFWMHQNTGEPPIKVHPQRREDLPLVGIFATRAPHRPNGIGVTTVELLKREGNILHIKGLDAIDGTPVLDIKPHIPPEPAIESRVPEWVSKLHRK